MPRILIPTGRIFKDGKVYPLDAVELYVVPIADFPNPTVDRFIVWVEIDSESSPTPTFLIDGKLKGWPGWPEQPNAPLTKYFQLAKVKTDSCNAYFIDRDWQGGDITWPSTGGGAGPSAQPFDIIVTKQADPSLNYDITLRPGCVNNLFPSNMSASKPYTANSQVYVWLAVTTTGRSVTSLTWEMGASPPVQGISSTSVIGPTSFNIMLGAVVANVAQQVQHGIITATLSQAASADRDPPVPGMSTIIRWYTWAVTFTLI